MKLYLYGHDYKYAAEQMLLTMFPGERPEYPEGRPEGERMELRLSRGDKYTTASCRLVLAEGEYRAICRAENSLMSDELLTDRVCQRLLLTEAGVYKPGKELARTNTGEGAPGRLLPAGALPGGYSSYHDFAALPSVFSFLSD